MVIFISGSINSGKTTIGKLLKTKFPHTAHIDDELHDITDRLPLEEAIALHIKNTLSLTSNFLEKDFNVIISYPIYKDEYEYFNKNLPIETERFFFTLNPRLDYALINRGTRELTGWEIERIKYHYQTGINNPDFGITIDNTMHTPEETVSEMLYYIEQRDIRREMED
ncbi:MAG: hypothetical protein K8I03_06695 [Ignavibacteria bacterium]|nr:hypothetical protein [Ignavibacteria bacterium]